MGRILIAGRPWFLPDDIPVTTFMDPGGLSFYSQTGPQFVAKTYVNDQNETSAHVGTRRLPPPLQGRAGLGGAGWAEAGEGDPLKALRKVIHTMVLHHDGSPSSHSCFQTLLKRGLSTHFMVDEDGHIYQATDVADEAVHASGVNAVSVGIDLNNPAPNLTNAQPGEVQGGARAVSRDMVINGTLFRSLTYTEAQYRSIIELLRALCEALGIEPVFPVGEDGSILDSVLQAPPPAEFRGIQCHWHSSADKWDPGPGLDWERILAGLRSEEAAVPAIPTGVYLALDPQDRQRWGREVFESDESARRAVTTALGAEETGERLLGALCRAAENGSGGGYYPMGINQTWHNGIHIPVRAGTIVRPLIPGELVAAHLVSRNEWPSLGSNNFVLLRHRIRLPPRFSVPETQADAKEKPPEENILTVFSLYMHLDGVDWRNPPQTGLFQRLLAHSSDQARPEPAMGPMLETSPKAHQVLALQQGYVGLFSPLDDPEGSIRLSPRDELWRAGAFGPEDERRTVLHLEVFADSRYAEAMELSLYGKYLELGPEEPESTDLVVRSRALLAYFGEPVQPFEPPIRTRKTLSAAFIREFFEERNDRDILQARAALRRLIVRHVSEWTPEVSWVQTLLAAQEAEDWFKRQRERGREVSWLFSDEIRTYLQYVWLTKEVAAHIGAQWDHGVFTFFHPINFLLWWLYRRSAVRGKTLEQMLEEVGGDTASLSRGVMKPLDDVFDLRGEGEWEI